MALGDVTVGGVERAIAEFDRLGREAFLDRFGFRKGRGYFLTRQGHRYDSKALVGVAHGYDRPDLGPLLAHNFSGGEATVARLLESLGFDVERPSRNAPWAEEELVLALDLYLRSGLLRATHPDVVELSRLLRDLPMHDERRDAERFRNENGVALKLANFAAIDPNHHGRGMAQFGKRDAEVWERYASNEEALAGAAEAVREGGALIRVQDSDRVPRVVVEDDVEAQHTEQFQVSIPRQIVEAKRREQTLVLAYRDYLESQGHRVTRHQYLLPGSGSALACDLVDETDHVLYEAKGDIRRPSVRMAIGQLLDYRRFESTPVGIAVLLPRQPSLDFIDLIRSVPAAVVWRTRDGFASRQSSLAGLKTLDGAEGS